jgi:hypothetical protein
MENRCVWVLAAIQLGVGGAVLRRFGDVSTEVFTAYPTTVWLFWA